MFWVSEDWLSHPTWSYFPYIIDIFNLPGSFPLQSGKYSLRDNTMLCWCYVLYVFHWLEIHIIGLHGPPVPYVWTFFHHPWFKSQVSRPSRFAQMQLWSSFSLFSSYGSIRSWRHHIFDIFCCVWNLFWYFRASWDFLYIWEGSSSNWEKDS